VRTGDVELDSQSEICAYFFGSYI